MSRETRKRSGKPLPSSDESFSPPGSPRRKTEAFSYGKPPAPGWNVETIYDGTFIPERVPRRRHLSDSYQNENFSEEEEELSETSSARQNSRNETSFPPKNDQSSFVTSFWGLLSIMAVVVVGCVVTKKFAAEIVPQTGPGVKNCSALLVNMHKFPSQSEFFWRTLKVNVESVLRDEPPQPSVIVFVHNDPKRAQDIVSRISGIIHSCFEPTRDKPLLLTAQDFSSPEMQEDYGLAISKYGETLRKAGVMFVHGVQGVPSMVVQAFHAFCDKETPLVEKAIILFTIQLEGANPERAGELYDLVEEKLAGQWKGFVPPQKIQPLLARMTETVLYLNTS